MVHCISSYMSQENCQWAELHLNFLRFIIVKNQCRTILNTGEKNLHMREAMSGVCGSELKVLVLG